MSDQQFKVFGDPDIFHDDSKPTTSAAEYRRVAMATMIGTTIEWYDFFIYANVAALLFGRLFFSGLGDRADLAAFATIGVSFFFRPLGAVAMGHIGDKYGRRIVLILTLVMMGVATALVGLLPTSAQIGIAAPILLIGLRCLQGFSAGGEWGGAAMLAVEHAPAGQRGKFGAYPQVGVPGGMLLAAGILALLTNTLSKESFDSWGWRLPFLFSIVLIFIGQYIRRRVAESPVFRELKEAKAYSKSPMIEVFKKNPKEILTAALIFIGDNALGYMLVGGFVLSFATATHKLERGAVLNWVLVAAACWIVTTIGAAIWSDRIGRKKVFIIGYIVMAVLMFPIFLLINRPSLGSVAAGLIIMTIPLGLCYGPLPALYAELFPARIRLSGVSISYAIGAILGGAFAPLIAQWLTQTTGTVMAVAAYLFVISLVSLGASAIVKDHTNEPLHTTSGH
ncbi:MAG TPA: MFS transporter [Dermatophilaceae bacterium]|nr:MFS transporter [Dermatophilaceae bacterium]